MPTDEQKKEAERLLGMSRDEIAALMLPHIQPVFDELERYKAAVEVARQKGEHYPVCNMPPREVMNADRETQRAWREANRGKCNCWKSEMERKLQQVE